MVSVRRHPSHKNGVTVGRNGFRWGNNPFGKACILPRGKPRSILQRFLTKFWAVRR